jgi:predicted RNase H-like nuclease
VNALLIGIDCATQDSKVGLALAAYKDGSVVLERATLCSRKQSAAGLLAGWAENVTLPVLFAVDAPLGWPAKMGSILNRHRAGQPLEVPANEFFRRTTDRFIYSLLGKTPLDVGADRIARTAHAALALLSDVSRRLNSPISLAWSPEVHGVATIEVYPAATLAARGVRSTGYKKPEHAAVAAHVKPRKSGPTSMEAPAR